MAHWIAENIRTKSVMWVCSECGKVAHDSPCGSQKHQVSKKPCSLQYCPHCGVKMDEEQETESMLTCFKCHGKGTYAVPIDPDYSWDECEQHRCEVCGGGGKITLAFYEELQKRVRKNE